MKVESGKKIKIEYELSRDDGTVIESSEGKGPLVYIHGQGRMLPQLEQRMEGMEVGDERDGTIPASEIYPDGAGLPTRTIKRDEFPDSDEVEIGRRFVARQGDEDVAFEVSEVTDDAVTVRMLGHDLVFRVKVLEVADVPKPPPPPSAAE